MGLGLKHIPEVEQYIASQGFVWYPVKPYLKQDTNYIGTGVKVAINADNVESLKLLFRNYSLNASNLLNFEVIIPEAIQDSYLFFYISVVYEVDLVNRTGSVSYIIGEKSLNPYPPEIDTYTAHIGDLLVTPVGIEFPISSQEDAVVVGTGKDGVNGYQEVIGKKYFNNRILFKQAIDLASANNLVLGNGRYFRLTNAVNELQTINNNGWTGGTDIILEIKHGQAIKHNAPDYGLGNYNGILLACQNDFTATQGLLLHLVWDNLDRKWKEVNGTTIAAITERPWYTAIKREQPCLVSTGNGIITGFVLDYLDDKTVTNEGTATPTKSADGSYIAFGTGTVFGVKIYSGATLIYEFPCNENNLYKNIVTDIIEGEYFIQTGFDSIGVQDSYFSSHDYGFCIVTEVGVGNTTVNYDTMKNPIFV
jgi:hypothetical protein